MKTVSTTNTTYPLSARRRGVAMVMVMIALTVATIITLSFLSSQTTSTAIAHNATRQVQARAIAEDGLRLVVEHLRATPDWRDGRSHGLWSSWETLNAGDFRVMFEDEDDSDLGDDVADPFVVTVEATYNGVVHRISSRLVPSANSSGQTVMLVTGDALHSDEDLLRIATLESWGYQVLTVADDDDQATYDTIAAEANVIYVSEEVDPNSVNTKLNGLSIGVVTEETGLVDELGLSTSLGAYFGDSIDITDNTHPMTAGFGLGELQITDVSTELNRAIGSAASGLNVLAEEVSSSTRVLVYLDAGDTMTDGNPSPQRRVMLPFGTNSFDFDELNANGRRLARQALSWAGEPAASGTEVDSFNRWPLDDTSGTTASEVIRGDDGSYVGGPTLNQSGQFSSAVQLDNSSDRITLPASSFDGLQQMTFAMWIKTNSSSEQALISMSTTRTDDALLLSLLNNAAMNLRVEFADGSTFSASSTGFGISNVADGGWHHVALVIDAVNDKKVVYVNGAIESDRSGARSILAEHVVLGEDQDSVNGGYDPAQAFVGQMDEVVLFDRALTQVEIQELMSHVPDATGVGGPDLLADYEFVESDPVTPTLVGHWKLDEARPIPGVGIAVDGGVTMFNNVVIDSYDSAAGPYSSATAGDDAYLTTNSTAADSLVIDGPITINGDVATGVGSDPAAVIFKRSSPIITGSEEALETEIDLPAIVAPAAPASSGYLSLFGSNSSTEFITRDKRYSGANLSGNSRIVIWGDVTVWFDGGVNLSNTAQIRLLSGSSATIYIDGQLLVSDDATVNGSSPSDPTALTVNMTGSGDRAQFSINANFYGTLNNPSGTVVVTNDADFYGKITAGIFEANIDAQVHIDTQLASGKEGTMLPAADAAQGNFGTLEGGVAPGQTGQDGSAYGFDGTDALVTVPHDDAYLINEGTVTCWFYVNDTNGTQVYVSKDGYYGADNGYLGLGQIGSTLVAVMRGNNTTYSITGSSGAIQTDRWYHAALGFGPGGMRLYLDGVLVASEPDHQGGLGTSSGGAGNTSPWLFGAERMDSSTVQNYLNGRLDEVQIFDRNLTAEQVADVMADTDPRSVIPSIVRDTSGFDTPLDLVLADPDDITWISGGGLQINNATVIASPGPATKLHDAIVVNDQFTLVADFTPANITQSGPAQIVTYSDGTSNRNFQLGQNASRANYRVRTQFHPSGSIPEIESADVLTANSRQHVVFTYDVDNEEIRVYRNGVLEITEPWSGELDNWNDSYQLLLANEVGESRPWLGTLHRVSIYDEAVNAIQAENLFNGDPPGDGTGGEEGLAYQVEWLESP